MGRRIYEAEEAGQTQNKASRDLSEIIGLPYQKFVVALKGLASDSKVQAVINAGKTDGKTEDEAFKFEEVDFDVKTLQPLQNEIDMDNSLLFPLSGKTNQLEDMLRGTPVQILGPVVVYNYKGTNYIVDGHHRWSQVYALNRDGKVKGIRLTSAQAVDPRRILKAAQLAIAAIKKEVKTSTAQGVNLLVIDENTLKGYVKSGQGSLKGFKGVPQEVLKRISSIKPELKDVDAVADYIWQNVLSMKKTSGTLWKKLNIKRDFMPQTDLGADGEQKDPDTRKTVQKMVSGAINFLSPSSKDVKPQVKEGRVIKTFEGFLRRTR